MCPSGINDFPMTISTHIEQSTRGPYLSMRNVYLMLWSMMDWKMN
uniref:Uncharacterized protein n=1 Tax=Arundo donax TaxID=35708 RepID=A0A0A9G087_ARUDO